MQTALPEKPMKMLEMNEGREKRKGQPYILGTRKGQQKMGYIWKWACCL